MSIFSEEHKIFLKKLKRKKHLIIFFQLIIIISFLITWELLVKFNIINSFTSSSPSMIIKTTINLFNDSNLVSHIYITLYEVLVSFLISFMISIIIATIFWRFKILSKIMDPYLTVLNSLPKVALGPLIIIWVGAKTSSIIFMALLISIFITIINIYNGFKSTDNSYITLMKSFKASRKDIFLKVVLPSNYTNIISAIKVNISMNLIGVIMGELLISKKGLGYLIMYGSQVFNINLVMTSVVLLGILSYLLYYIVYSLEKIVQKKTE